MMKLIYVILVFGVLGNIAIYFALYKVRKSKQQQRRQVQAGRLPKQFG